jgi:hypothetical protein
VPPLQFWLTVCQPAFVHFDHVAELGLGGPGRGREALAVVGTTAVKIGRVLPERLRLDAAVGIVDHHFAPLPLGFFQVGVAPASILGFSVPHLWYVNYLS